MRDYSVQNKKAWEFDAYNFWVKTSGTPEDELPGGKAVRICTLLAGF